MTSSKSSTSLDKTLRTAQNYADNVKSGAAAFFGDWFKSWIILLRYRFMCKNIVSKIKLNKSKNVSIKKVYVVFLSPDLYYNYFWQIGHKLLLKLGNMFHWF